MGVPGFKYHGGGRKGMAGRNAQKKGSAVKGKKFMPMKPMMTMPKPGGSRGKRLTFGFQ